MAAEEIVGDMRGALSTSKQGSMEPMFNLQSASVDGSILLASYEDMHSPTTNVVTETNAVTTSFSFVPIRLPNVSAWSESSAQVFVLRTTQPNGRGE